MRDPLTKAGRSELMSKVRSKGNKSTEEAVAATLFRNRIRGWLRHPRNVAGQPDFYFPRQKLAVFVDGCFWHACPACARRTPQTRRAFWRRKIEGNRRRDERVRRKLRASGCHSMRIWEHEVRRPSWLKRLRRTILRISTRP